MEEYGRFIGREILLTLYTATIIAMFASIRTRQLVSMMMTNWKNSPVLGNVLQMRQWTREIAENEVVEPKVPEQLGEIEPPSFLRVQTMIWMTLLVGF